MRTAGKADAQNALSFQTLAKGRLGRQCFGHFPAVQGDPEIHLVRGHLERCGFGLALPVIPAVELLFFAVVKQQNGVTHAQDFANGAQDSAQQLPGLLAQPHATQLLNQVP